MIGLFIRMVLLVVMAVLLSGLANLFLPNRIVWVEDWGHYIEAQAYKENFSLANYASVQRALEAGTYILLDARPAFDYDEGHISGALSLPADDVQDNLDVLPILTPADHLLIYCAGYECDESLVLARYMRESGFTNLVIYPGGWSDWTSKQREAKP